MFSIFSLVGQTDANETVTTEVEEKSLDGSGSNLVGNYFMFSLPLEESSGHEYWGLRLSGAGSLNKYSSLHLGGELGSYDLGASGIEDTFLRIKLSADYSLYRNIAKHGIFSRVTPFAKAGIEWDYFSNEDTTTYTTGYDFSPLRYSDYYWEYTESYTTGTSFDFFNYTISVGVHLELVREKLFFTYNLLNLNTTEGDFKDVTKNKYELFFRPKNMFYYVSYQAEDLYWPDNKLWTFGIGGKF